MKKNESYLHPPLSFWRKKNQFKGPKISICTPPPPGWMTNDGPQSFDDTFFGPRPKVFEKHWYTVRRTTVYKMKTLN